MRKVYVKTDESGRITGIQGEAFLADPAGWTQLDEGEGDKFQHAQGNYFPQPLLTEEGVYRYKLADGQAVERTAEEIAADVAALPAPPASTDTLQTAQIQALADRNEFLEDCIAEMAGMVYAG